MSLAVTIENERRNLTADGVGRASTGCLVVGTFAPLATVIQGQAPIPALGLVVSIAGWLVTAGVLHFTAWRVLKWMKQ